MYMCKYDCPPEYLVNKEQSLCAGLSAAALAFGAPPMEMRCDVKIPWNMMIKIGYSIGNTSFANFHDNIQDYWSNWTSLCVK